MPTERLLQVIERQLGDLVPQADPSPGFPLTPSAF
jgi:hypothetical protein